MRILSGNNYGIGEVMSAADSGCTTTPEGEDTYSFTMPMGMTVKSSLEANNSTSISIFNSAGENVMFWNSGTWVSCMVIGTGVGMMVTSFSMNPLLGALAARLTQYGCTHYVNRTYEDGDSYTC